ncbi:MAG: hypothetical protein ACRENY_01030 [Candidatus Dormibacteria bacterium]
MDAPRALAFAAIALVVIAVPGPSVLFIVGRAVAVGRRAALITVLGNTRGRCSRCWSWHLEWASCCSARH